ncbi:virulence RhuM family protein [Patescibacteria group bacterium]|nr:virulence RhuM family protein [Patescibacteria group bacterium]
MVKLRGDFERETVWASQAEIASVFAVNVRPVNEHIKNIYKSGDLQEAPTIRNFRIVQTEGKRTIERDVIHYNLDTIISIGYRVNSKLATDFRQWATKTLREHITKGFTINRSQIGAHYEEFQKAVETLKSLAPAKSNVDTESVLELVRAFADTWFSLDAYDKEALTPKKVTKRSVALTAITLMEGVSVLKGELMHKGEATDNFATERNRGAVEGIIGNVMQSFGGQTLYPTVEEKAAHLLYFIIKNHPFVDGNKRTGAYAFIWYLQKAKLLNTSVIRPATLTALTLLIAESDPQDKEKMVKLVVMLLGGLKR